MIDHDNPRGMFMSKAADPQDWPLEPYHGYLLALARVRLGPRFLRGMGASDLVQQTLLKAHQHKHQFRGKTEAEWQAWLRRILANTLADAFQLPDQRRIRISLDQTSARLKEYAAEQSSPSEKVQRDELLLRLGDALTQLSEDERVALELRYFQDPRWSLEDIARHLGRPTEKAAAGVLARGLKKLKTLLSNCR